MTDAGYYRGTTADQDNRFQDKEKKLMKTLKFSDNLNEPVDMRKVSINLGAAPVAAAPVVLTSKRVTQSFDLTKVAFILSDNISCNCFSKTIIVSE